MLLDVYTNVLCMAYTRKLKNIAEDEGNDELASSFQRLFIY